MATFGKWNWYNPIKRLRRVQDNDKAKPAETAANPSQAEEKPQ
jgi:hypothetical protein